MTPEEIDGLIQALTVFTLAIVLVGAMLIAREVDDPLGWLLAFVAVAFATMNVVGGYVVTDRMLQMFRKKPVAPKAAADQAEA